MTADTYRSDLLRAGDARESGVHTCSYVCPRPACMAAQRAELLAECERLRGELALRPDVPTSFVRYFASGPEGAFFASDYDFAETAIARCGFDRNEWTVADLEAAPEQTKESDE